MIVNNHNDCNNCDLCFEASILSILSKEELETINTNRIEVAFRKGEIIYKQGTPLTHIVIVHTGFGKIYIENNNGKNLILAYTNKSHLNGGIGVFLDQRHHSSLMAVTDCNACFVEINAFKEVFQSNTVFMEAYLKEHSKMVQHVYNQFSLLTQKNMEGRIAESILYLKEQIFVNGSDVKLPKQDFADLTAMTKESAIRVIKQFKDDGLIEVDNSTIKVLDKKSLELIALHG